MDLPRASPTQNKFLSPFLALHTGIWCSLWPLMLPSPHAPTIQNSLNVPWTQLKSIPRPLESGKLHEGTSFLQIASMMETTSCPSQPTLPMLLGDLQPDTQWDVHSILRPPLPIDVAIQPWFLHLRKVTSDHMHHFLVRNLKDGGPASSPYNPLPYTLDRWCLSPALATQTKTTCLSEPKSKCPSDLSVPDLEMGTGTPKPRQTTGTPLQGKNRRRERSTVCKANSGSHRANPRQSRCVCCEHSYSGFNEKQTLLTWLLCKLLTLLEAQPSLTEMMITHEGKSNMRSYDIRKRRRTEDGDIRERLYVGTQLLSLLWRRNRQTDQL